jgi:PAS domain S-box-containing protein
MQEHVEIPESTHRRLMRMPEILQHGDLIALLADADGRVLYATPACERVSGLDQEALHAATYKAVFRLTDEQQDRLARRIAQGTSCTLTTTARREDGTSFPIELTASPIAREQGARGVAFLATDISQRQQLERDLQACEERLRLIFDHPFDGISLYEEYPDGSRTLIDCNERYAEMAGRSKQELIEIGNTNHLQTWVIEEDNREAYLAALWAGQPYQGLFSWIRPDGKDNVIEYNARLVRIGDRTLTIGFDRDITERARAEEAQRESENTLRLIFDNAFDGISLYEEHPDGSRTLIDCNERYAEMAGRSKQDLLEIGDTLPIQRTTGGAEDRGPFLEALREQRAYLGRFSWVRPDSKDNVIEYNARLVRIGGKTLTIGFDRDITERVRAVEALQASEEKYRQLVENANDAILVAQDGFLKFFNPKTIEITGYSRQQLASMPFTELIHPDDVEMVTDRHMRRLQGETLPSVYSFRIVDATGNVKWVEINAILISWEGQPATLNLVGDISERVRTDRALRAKTRQQEQLIETARHLASSLELEEVLRRIGVGAKEILHAFGCTIYLCEPDGRTLRPVIAVDPAYRQELLATPLDIDSSFTGQGVKAGRGLISNDAGTNPSGYQIPGTPVSEEEYVLAVPFTVDHRVLGAMCLNRTDERFTTEDLVLAETFATYAATVLKNAQTHAELQREVEERKRAEDVLAESEERYRSTIDAMPDLVHAVDADLRFVLWNEALETRLESLGIGTVPLGKDVFEVFAFLPPTVRTEYQHVLDSGESLLTEEATQIGTETFWTETRKIPMRDNQGRVYRIVTIVRDITAQKQTDRALRHRLAMEELVADISTRFIHVSPHELEPEIRRALRALGEFVDVDRCYLHLFSEDLSKIVQAYEWSAQGIEPREEELIGQPIGRLRWAMEKKRRLEVMHVPRVADLPPEASPEREVWSAIGVRSVLSIPITRASKPIGALGFNTLRAERQWSQEDIRLLNLVGDILSNVLTRQRAQEENAELEDRLVRAQRMESLGVLAGGVAHDLNNLLGPLVGYPDLLLTDLPADSPSRRDVLIIKESAERAAAVVQDLLTLARRGAYRMTPLSLNQVVQEYLRSPALRELKARYPHVLVDVELDPELPNVQGSVSHLTKVLMNLVTNAFEAMPYGGKLTIRTLCKSLDRPIVGYEHIEARDYILLHVCDTGVGIETVDLGRVFEPFYTKKQLGRSGSGLGLAVVYGVVHDHGGRIDVHTEIGQGTEFALYFPITWEAALSETDQSAKDYLGDETVLVVDDLETQRQLAVRLLSSLGYQVTAVASGREAVDYLRENTADILVLDMIMEDDFDGLDTYRAIAQTHPGQKAIIASGFSETERVKETQKLGAGPFLRKPYTLHGLGKAVRRELDKP